MADSTQNAVRLSVAASNGVVRKQGVKRARPPTDNAVAVWDFTKHLGSEDTHSRSEMVSTLNEYCKKWCYQVEQCKNGMLHLQGRFSLKVKARRVPIEMAVLVGHHSPTNKMAKDDFYYVSKHETRVSGPYKDTDEEVYIPRQIRHVTALREWQNSVVEICQVWNDRAIDIIHDPVGNNGKSVLCQYMYAKRMGFPMPPVNDFKDIMRIAMDMKKYPVYFIDMPRAMKKEKLSAFYSGIEYLKQGYAYDDRYKFKFEHFDSPNIWIFTNVMPDMAMLSEDRWRVWNIRDGKLVQMTGPKYQKVPVIGRIPANQQVIDLTEPSPITEELTDSDEDPLEITPPDAKRSRFFRGV